MSKLSTYINSAKNSIWRNKLLVAFLSLHLLFAIFLGRLFALAPDEGAYLYTFNNLYGSQDPNPQLGSGWITAPKPFLWILYLPAKIINLIGVPDYISIRLLSILFAAVSLVLLRNLQSRSSGKLSRFDLLIFLFFFVPSIFLWTSVGLRETFILAEMSLLFVGLHCLLENELIRATAFLSIGSYGLLSTKNYLWVCFALSVLVIGALRAMKRIPKTRYANFLTGAILLPCIVFASTTSLYAFEFLVSSVFHSNLSATGDRSGDSVVQVAIPITQTGSSESSSNKNSSTPPASSSPSASPAPSSGKTVVTFHGETTLIKLHFYLTDHPSLAFSRTLQALGIKSKIDDIWDSKVKSSLAKQAAKELPVSSSPTGYILKPGKLHDPLSVIKPAFLFVFGPIPFMNQGGFALKTVALESPLWWLLYGVVLYRLIRYRKNGYLKDPVFMLAATYFLSLVAVSALVEVNLGTSFRHRSILLIPLIVMFIRAKKKSATIAY